MRYSQYNPDLAYPEILTDGRYPEWYGRDVKCLQKTKTTKAGEMLECQSFPLFLNRTDYMRAKKSRPTKEVQAALNARNAARNFIRKVNANFSTGDLWGTFGWDYARMPSTMDEAWKEVGDFVSRLRYHRHKAGLKGPKYMFVIESEPGRLDKGEPETKYHVHMFLDGEFDRDRVEQLWKGGEYPQTRRLRVKDFGGLTGVASYLTKKPEGRRRWGQSKGLKPYSRKPTESVRKLSKAKINRIVKAYRNDDAGQIKDILERAYPGYVYDHKQSPCEIYCNREYGGTYLYCRMYRRKSKKE